MEALLIGICLVIYMALLIRELRYTNFYKQGMKLARLERYQEAIAICDEILKFMSYDGNTRLNRGLLLSKLGRYEEAIASYDRALEYEPNAPGIWCNRGITLINLGCYDEAITNFDRSLKSKLYDRKVWNSEWNESSAWMGRGYALFKLERYEEAINSFDRAISHKPDFSEAFYSKACCLALQAKIELALDCLQKAIHLNPNEYVERAKTELAFAKIGQDKQFLQMLAE